jgi:hypothetical protein
MRKNYLSFLLFFVFFPSSSIFAQERKCNLKESDFTHPPEMYSRSTIERWVLEAAQHIRPNLPVKIMGTAEWSNYMNCRHFVPPGSDPHAGGKEDEFMDYNWSSETYQSRGLATAEVTETGEFNFWWNRCNYKKMSEQRCKWFIDLVIKHEGRHYDQWQNIAVETMNSFGTPIYPNIPKTIEDVKFIPGAYDRFMAVWSDVGHYQCREVEDYSMNFLTGEFPQFLHDERIPYMMWYTEKCEKSKWAAHFYPHILRAKAIEKWWKLGGNPKKK